MDTISAVKEFRLTVILQTAWPKRSVIGCGLHSVGVKWTALYDDPWTGINVA